jgi:hypothetical protein
VTSLGGELTTVRPSAISSTLDAGEALSFARDLRGSLTHVLVAAAGRALETAAVLRTRLASEQGASGVGVVTVRAGEVVVWIVRGAGREPLPQLREEIDAILLAHREGRRVADAEGPAALAVVEREPGAGSPAASVAGVPLVLEAESLRGDPTQLALSLHLEPGVIDPAGAEALLFGIAQLLRRPYRRLL